MAARRKIRSTPKSAAARTAKSKTTPAKSASSLEDRLGHRFADRSLLALALTHAGAAGGIASNERLEFLGDRVLGTIVAAMVYRQFPKEKESDLARRFVAAVRAETLTEIAEAIGLENELTLAPEAAAARARGRAGMLANACEALIGALYLDGGMAAAEAFVIPLWKTRLKTDAPPPKDAKTELQEWAQAHGLPLPLYREISRSGPAHAPRFVIDVELKGHPSARGQGPSKRAAEQAGADSLLRRLETEKLKP